MTMKKTAALILAVILIVSVAATCFAAHNHTRWYVDIQQSLDEYSTSKFDVSGCPNNNRPHVHLRKFQAYNIHRICLDCGYAEWTKQGKYLYTYCPYNPDVHWRNP